MDPIEHHWSGLTEACFPVPSSHSLADKSKHSQELMLAPSMHHFCPMLWPSMHCDRLRLPMDGDCQVSRMKRVHVLGFCDMNFFILQRRKCVNTTFTVPYQPKPEPRAESCSSIMISCQVLLLKKQRALKTLTSTFRTVIKSELITCQHWFGR